MVEQWGKIKKYSKAAELEIGRSQTTQGRNKLCDTESKRVEEDKTKVRLK